MKQNQQPRRPSHQVYIVEGEGETGFWTKVGALWPHKDGKGFNLELTAVPLDGRLTIREPKTEPEDGE